MPFIADVVAACHVGGRGLGKNLKNFPRERTNARRSNSKSDPEEDALAQRGWRLAGPASSFEMREGVGDPGDSARLFRTICAAESA